MKNSCIFTHENILQEDNSFRIVLRYTLPLSYFCPFELKKKGSNVLDDCKIRTFGLIGSQFIGELNLSPGRMK